MTLEQSIQKTLQATKERLAFQSKRYNHQNIKNLYVLESIFDLLNITDKEYFACIANIHTYDSSKTASFFKIDLDSIMIRSVLDWYYQLEGRELIKYEKHHDGTNQYLIRLMAIDQSKFNELLSHKLESKRAIEARDAGNGLNFYRKLYQDLFMKYSLPLREFFKISA